MNLQICNGRIRDSGRWHSLVHLYTLILANDIDQLSQVRSIAAYLIRDQYSSGRETRYLRDRNDDGSIWPEHRWDTFEIDGQGGERIEEIKIYRDPIHDPAPTTIENGGETNQHARLPMGLATYLRPDEGFAIVGLDLGCGKVFGRWQADNEVIDPHWERNQHVIGKGYMDVEDVKGPWTKEQYERRNESSLHTGMSKFGIITKRITDGPKQCI
ncbi:hypothetical protein FACUT_12827 [Fusarium acutatum]|uniref:Uncharacterized protein n=1 Tax=Fusarium acutatum TaxID=78861 RepID=A0A8H4JAG2_9HYPO|nr:hypothetical protein FACUT_12827 [Fusarium acutatum]